MVDDSALLSCKQRATQQELSFIFLDPSVQDGQWSIFHFSFAVFSPVPMSIFLLLVATGGWSGFTLTVGSAGFPVAVLVVLCGKGGGF